MTFRVDVVYRRVKTARVFWSRKYFAMYCNSHFHPLVKGHVMSQTNQGNLRLEPDDEHEVRERYPSLDVVLEKLAEFAPLSLAESWDNVGLLIGQASRRPIKRILLTNDLTKQVTQEAVEKSVDLIISYHPPIFAGMKRITNDSMAGFDALQCISNNIAVYSPHTSWDSVKGGNTDWIANSFDYTNICAIEPKKIGNKFTNRVRVTWDPRYNVMTSAAFSKIVRNPELRWQTNLTKGREENRFVILSTDNGLEDLREVFLPNDLDCLETSPDALDQGIGRICVLKSPIRIREVISKLKGHFGIDSMQLALAEGLSIDSDVKTIAMVAGSGGSILKDVKNADLAITGEASHHELLQCSYNRLSVLLTNHSNCERAYLSVFETIFTSILNNENVSITISERDKDPLIFVF